MVGRLDSISGKLIQNRANKSRTPQKPGFARFFFMRQKGYALLDTLKMVKAMAAIFLYGNATWDCLFSLEKFLIENSEQRVADAWQSFGGNAANSAAVLAQAGHQVQLAAALPAHDAKLRQALVEAGVSLTFSEDLPGETPLSFILLNQSTGSRSILHYRGLSELSATVFAGALASSFFSEQDWLHFEGRNIPLLQEILPKIRQQLRDQPLSLEVEKPRPGLPDLLPLADVLFFSQSFADLSHANDPEGFLAAQAKALPEKLLVVSAGSAGAYARVADKLYFAQAPTVTVQDSRGAGDTFHAALIHALVQRSPVALALEFAVNLAAKKCSQRGLSGLFSKKSND
jgi:ketohexokinase